MDTTDSAPPPVTKMLTDDLEDTDGTHEEVQGFTEGANRADFKLKRVTRNIFINHSRENPGPSYVTRNLTPNRERCPSPVSSIVGAALNQMNLKRSSSAPMINQLGVTPPPPENPRDRLTLNIHGLTTSSSEAGPSSSCSTPSGNTNTSNRDREVSMELDAASFASSFLASLNNPRPRRFSASFSPGSPGPAPNRVSQLRRQENTPDWESVSEKEFHGTMNMAQSWEDLSLESMSMEIPARRPSYTDQLWLSMPPGNSSASASASSSPAASPRVGNRFSPGISSPSPTRKSFTSRRSLSPIAVRPSVLSLGLTAQAQGLKRKSDWDSSSNNQMDCSPQPPAKRMGGLLGFNPTQLASCSTSSSSSGSLTTINHIPYSPTPNHYPVHQLQHHLMLPNSRGSPNSLETGTESSVSSVSGGGDSPFFRPLDSPVNTSSDILSESTHTKM